MSAKKRLIFCTYSSVYSSIVLEQFLICHQIEVVAVINSTRVFKPKYGHIRGAIKQIQTTGLRYATYLFLITDGFSFLQLFKKPKKDLLNTIHRMAAENNIPIHDTRDINDQVSLDFISKQSADMLIAAHFNQLIKANILESNNFECLNIHPSLLPAYKGVDPAFYAMLNQESELGVTLHKMAETFDSGEILLKTNTSNDFNDSLFIKNCELFEMGAKLLIEYLSSPNDQKRGGCASLSRAQDKPSQLNRIVLNNDDSSKDYDSWPTKEKISRFNSLGKKLIDLKSLWRVNSPNHGICKND